MCCSSELSLVVEAWGILKPYPFLTLSLNLACCDHDWMYLILAIIVMFEIVPQKGLQRYVHNNNFLSECIYSLVLLCILRYVWWILEHSSVFVLV